MIKIDLGKDDLATVDENSSKQRALKNTIRATGLNRVEKSQQIYLILILLGALLVAVIPIFFIGQYKASVSRQHQEQNERWQVNIKQISTQIQKLSAYKTELESFSRQKEITERRLGAVRQLLSVRATPVRVLNAIGQSLPGRSWIQSVELDLGKEAPTVDVIGNAISNEEISDYIDRLNESVYLSDVRLKSVNTTASSTDGGAFKKFHITGLTSFEEQ